MGVSWFSYCQYDTWSMFWTKYFTEHYIITQSYECVQLIVNGGTRRKNSYLDSNVDGGGKRCFDNHGGQATCATRIPCGLVPSEDCCRSVCTNQWDKHLGDIHYNLSLHCIYDNQHHGMTDFFLIFLCVLSRCYSCLLKLYT